MNRELTRSCPLCESSERSIRKFFEEYTVVNCDDCGFMYVADPDENTTSEKGVNENNARHTTIPQAEKRHHYTVNLLEEKFGGSTEVLEIGAGYGPLGQLLENKGHEYIGFEPSEVRATIATEEGVNVINDIYDAESVNKEYDAIVLDNVVEHIQNPKDVLRDSVTNLKNGGVIIGIVPSRYDLRRIQPKWNKTQFWIPHAHINFFRPCDLKRLYRLAGLKMKPFPSKVFGVSETKDKLFSIKATVEKTGWYPASLYTYGSKSHRE